MKLIVIDSYVTYLIRCIIGGKDTGKCFLIVSILRHKLILRTFWKPSDFYYLFFREKKTMKLLFTTSILAHFLPFTILMISPSCASTRIKSRRTADNVCSISCG